MTAEEKITLAHFLYTAQGFLGTGYAGEKADAAFEDDLLQETEISSDASEVAEPSSLPLAYLVDEDSEEMPVLVIGANLTEQEAQLLDQMLASIGLYKNRNCYVSGIFEDNAAFEQLINKQNPRMILSIGKDAFDSLSNASIISDSGIQVIKTLHPGELLRDKTLKRPAFDDMKQLMTLLAEVDSDYRNEVKELIKKYAATDQEFASRLSEHIQEPL
jgi:DNA polymerase